MAIEVDVTRLLGEWKNGSLAARDQLIPLLYGELHRMAARYLRNERAADTLQPTALVHEAYMRLVQQKLPDWESRAQFFGIAAHLMRQLLVEHARHGAAVKRGGGVKPLELDESISFAPSAGAMVVNLDEGLRTLAEVNERQSKIIELRYFGGFQLDEVAKALDVSEATVKRDQRLALAWLHRYLKENPQ